MAMGQGGRDSKRQVCTGSLVRVPDLTRWQLTTGVALVIGLNLTPHGTS